MRAYIVGHGSIAQRHMRNLSAILPNTRFLLQRPRSNVLAGIPDDVEFIDTATEAIRAGIDLAVVASATADHIAVLPALIAAQVPMYVEKPVVATSAELQSVREAINAAGYQAPSAVGCNLRYLPSLERARTALLDGAIGRVARAHLEAGQWLPDWRPGRDYRGSYSADASRGGGVVLDLIHELDAARWMLGEFDRVQSDLGTRSGLEITAEDTAGILLSQPGGPLVVVSLDYVSRRSVRRYSFVGDRGSLTWDLPAASLTLSDSGGIHELSSGVDEFNVTLTYVRAMSDFVAAVRTGTNTAQPLAEGLRTMELAMQVKEAKA